MYDENGGPFVSMVTGSAHPKFSASAILDGKPNTFWVSSGLYPQQLIISLPQAVQLSALNISCVDGKWFNVFFSFNFNKIDR